MTGEDTIFIQKRLLLQALLARPTVQEAARDAGVSLSTAFRWRCQPKFRARLEALRRDQFEQGLQNLQTLGSEAAETLRRNLACGTPGVEVTAAVRVIELGLRFAALADISRRPDEREHSPRESVPVSVRWSEMMALE